MKMLSADIATIPHAEARGFDAAARFSVSGVSTDSRTVHRGELFVAVRGERFDGHNFISLAVRNGAAAIVIEKRWADVNGPMLISMPIPRLIVEDSTIAFGQLANVYRSQFKIPVVAVGGSNGKTTTKEMVRAVLARKYRVLATEGNLNNHIGVPQTLFRLEPSHEVAVVEVGTNHPGEISYLCDILRPTHGLITNIGREHLEFFGTVDGVADAEAELFAYLRGSKGTAFVNADDALIAKRSKPLTKKKTFGMTARSVSVKGRIVSMNNDGCAVLSLTASGKKPFRCTLRVPGLHNAMNALAAATVGLSLRVSVADVVAALESFSAASKRMQVEHVGGITVLNDTYNANPDSVLAALSTLKSIRCAGKRVAVLADMLELGPEAAALHRSVGTAASQNAVDVLYTFGPLSKHTHDGAAIAEKKHFEHKTQLIEELVKLIANGDAVLVKGSRGMKMEEVVAVLAERVPQKGQS